MASLSLDNSEIVRSVLQEMGAGRTAANIDAATEADLRQIIRDGLRRFYFPVLNGAPYQWRWLEKLASFSIVAFYSTGTIAVSGGVVTLTAGSFPDDMTDYFIAVDGHVLFVTVDTDATHVTVSNTQLAVTAGAEYVAYKYRYALPSDFSEWLGGVIYANGSNTRQLVGADESELRLRYAIGQGQNSETTHFVVTSTPTVGERRIIFWPVPEPDAFVQGVFLSAPLDNLPADLSVPGSTVQCPPAYAEALIEAILAQADAYNQINGQHEARFNTAIMAAILHDSASGGVYDFTNRVDNTRGIGQVLPIQFEP